ncbi:MAG: hypothetical protein WCO00_01635 [Rhodospirillaceae bacterium]
MLKARLFSGIGAVLLMAAAGLIVSPASAADGKQPPACAAISFRPVAGTPPDGEQDSGLYKSRFVKIELKATVKAGLATNYYLLINGQKADGVGAPPKGSDGCLKSKHIAVPVKAQPAGACTGERFRVAILRSGKDKTALLFGLHGSEWQFCSGSKI